MFTVWAYCCASNDASVSFNADALNRGRCTCCKKIIWSAASARSCNFSAQWVCCCNMTKKNLPSMCVNGRSMAGRGERIRTSGLYVPNVALYQTKLHPEFQDRHSSKDTRSGVGTIKSCSSLSRFKLCFGCITRAWPCRAVTSIRLHRPERSPLLCCGSFNPMTCFARQLL